MSFHYQDQQYRAAIVAGVRRVVIKVGTRLLTDVSGVSKKERIDQLVAQIALLRQRGLEVILVTSGAIGAGIQMLGTGKRPKALPGLQAHAAVGQCRLMTLYETACEKHGFHAGQLLLTAADVRDRERNLNVANCLEELLALGVLPVVNENDSVCVDEIKVGDNDTLAALVANMARADLTLLLTTIDGMRERIDEKLGARLSVVERLTPKIKAMASGTDGNPFSVGGMATKLKAADMVTRAGEAMWIVEGQDFSVLQQVFAAADIGTLFLPLKGTRMGKYQRFLAFFSPPVGDLLVDAGAARAICAGGKSLLPIGIRAVRGNFKRGATVKIINPAGEEIARGVCNYESSEVDRIKGRQTTEVPAVLGCEAYDEVVHRDHLALTQT